MTVINTNTAATLTANALTKNERAMNQTMERLSTGQRINSAADDAAGLAISSKMTSQINGLNMAVKNANDAISMIQTADGAMIEVTNMLQRMRELAVQAASDTNTSTDRASLNVEFQALGAEITRIGGNTQWNGVNILDGVATSGAQDFQVGANANQVIQHTFATIGKNSSTISQAETVAGSGGGTQKTTLTIAGTANGDVVTGTINGQAFALL
jgi:flagellin